MDTQNILVCVTQQKTCERLIRKAAEIKRGDNGNLHVIHVVRSDLNFLNNEKEGEALEYLFAISKSVGANLSVIKSDHVIEAIAGYATDNNISCLILGESPKGQKENRFQTELKRRLKNIEIRVIP